jgi:hypothetical protein
MTTDIMILGVNRDLLEQETHLDDRINQNRI